MAANAVQGSGAVVSGGRRDCLASRLGGRDMGARSPVAPLQVPVPGCPVEGNARETASVPETTGAGAGAGAVLRVVVAPDSDCRPKSEKSGMPSVNGQRSRDLRPGEPTAANGAGRVALASSSTGTVTSLDPVLRSWIDTTASDTSRRSRRARGGAGAVTAHVVGAVANTSVPRSGTRSVPRRMVEALSKRDALPEHPLHSETGAAGRVADCDAGRRHGEEDVEAAEEEEEAEEEQDDRLEEEDKTEEDGKAEEDNKVEEDDKAKEEDKVEAEDKLEEEAAAEEKEEECVDRTKREVADWSQEGVNTRSTGTPDKADDGTCSSGPGAAVPLTWAACRVVAPVPDSAGSSLDAGIRVVFASASALSRSRCCFFCCFFCCFLTSRSDRLSMSASISSAVSTPSSSSARPNDLACDDNDPATSARRFSFLASRACRVCAAYWVRAFSWRFLAPWALRYPWPLGLCLVGCPMCLWICGRLDP